MSVCTLRMSTNGGSTTTSTACELLLGQAERELLGQRDRLEVVEVHLPVAGDQRLAAARTAEARSRDASPSSDSPRGRRRPAASCPRGTPATRRRRSRCGRTRSRRGRARARPPPSRRRRRRTGPSTAATASATPRVPAANGATSNTPIGPFQNTVAASASAAANAATDSGPMSRPFVAGRDRVGRRRSAVGASSADLGRDHDVGRQHDLVAGLGRGTAGSCRPGRPRAASRRPRGPAPRGR